MMNNYAMDIDSIYGRNANAEKDIKIPQEILCDPSLLFLYYRIEQILGISAGYEALKNLNEYIEENCGSTFVKDPASYEHMLTSREQIYNLSKFLTVNETYFFRESIHFTLLSEMLPELAKHGRKILICSAACSIGCEPYSIAMLLDYHAKKGLDFDFTIDAFDVDSEAIETAKNARYTSNTIRSDGAAWKHVLDMYLIETNGDYLVHDTIREKVKFFTHNIMRGLDRHYDIIFYRNSLIYFTKRSRYYVVNNIASSLFENGCLFTGISETSSVKHPFFASRYSYDVFYFQKTSAAQSLPRIEVKHNDTHSVNEKENFADIQSKPASKEIFAPKTRELSIECMEIDSLLKIEEGKPIAQNVLELIEKEETGVLSGGSLAASVLYYINAHDFGNADKILSYLEKQNTGVYTKFLRGEFYFQKGNQNTAEKYYQEAAEKEKMFWPAFYRIASIASEGNETRYKYRINKAIESIELAKDHKNGKNYNFECFMGNFSSDYFVRIMEKKLT